MDRILREYQRIVQQHQATLPMEVLQYINLLEKLASGHPGVPEGVNTLTDAEMRALAVIVRFAAERCGGGEDTIGAILYTGAFHQLGGMSQQATHGEQRENGERTVHLARIIDRFMPSE